MEPSPPLDEILGPLGPVATAMGARVGAFEERPQQLRMAHAVDEALRAGRHLIVEAGTGVGKSFGYLVPALLWAAEHGKKVAVATSTIALQEQLAGKDLPLLASCLPVDASFALVKGRGNYLCARRLDLARQPSLDATSELFPDEGPRLELERIAAFSALGMESRQDLPFSPREDVWDAVRAESGNCLHKACPHYERCGYQASRRRTHAARLLVMNHHVLLSDLALRRSGASFLPDVDAIVVDEAHDLEDAAADTLGSRVTSRGLAYQLGRLWHDRRDRGLLARHPDPALKERVEEARRAARSFFDKVKAAHGSTATAGLRAIEGPVDVDGSLPQSLEDLAREMVAGADAVDRDLALELSVRAQSVLALAEQVEDVVQGPDDEHVAWLEWDARGQAVIVRTPVDVGPSLRVSLYDAFPTVVLTSATLSTGRPASFRYVRDRLGLKDAEEVSLGSPFDFTRQARIIVRTDLPDPSRAPEAYEEALPEAVLEAVRRTGGGAFVLFTSYESMRRTAQAVRAHLEGDGLEVLVQGEDLPRTAMLEKFREKDSVLFGVSSFWQGVDVPGDALRNVVIARLPFEVPTHPLVMARQARVEREGRSAFTELSLPQAALKLKQGFGRLIRRATDRGLVVLLDSRIVTKPYGRALLETLPECPVDLVPELPD